MLRPNCAGTDPCIYFRVSPNPVKNGDIVIIAKPAPIECPPIDLTVQRINVYDQNGTLVQTSGSGKPKDAGLRMSTARKGIFIVEISTGKHTERHKIIMQ